MSFFDQDHQDSIRREFRELYERLDQIMSDFTAQNAAVAKLASTVTAVKDEVAKLAAAGASDQPAIDATTAAIESAVTELEAALPAPPAVQARSVYTVDPGTAIDAQWTLTAEETADPATPPQALYEFSGDVNPGDALGANVLGWHLYTGAVQPVPAV